ncbi:hypothetical protein DYB31_015488, partial [Aphanomyces astaci]
SLREENAVRAEQFSIRCLYRFTVRALEATSLLVAQPHTTTLSLALPELVTTTTGAAACKVLIQKLMADAGHSEELVHQLRDECPLLFTDTDAAECHGFQALDAAATCVTAHDQQLTKPDVAPLRRMAYSGIVQAIQYLTQNDTELPICGATSTTLWTDQEEREAAIGRILGRVLASSDTQLHLIVLTWLYDHDQKKRLVTLKGPHVEAFLQAKDPELLVSQYLVQERYVDAAHVLWTRARCVATAGASNL